MHDTTLLQLIEDDIAPTQELLELLQKETVALHGRDMQTLEAILARKQSLIVLLEQQGMRRNHLLQQLGLSADRAGVQAVAAQSVNGEIILQQLDVLTGLMDACQKGKQTNGRVIQVQHHATAHQIRIPMGGASPPLSDSPRTTPPLHNPRALSKGS